MMPVILKDEFHILLIIFIAPWMKANLWGSECCSAKETVYVAQGWRSPRSSCGTCSTEHLQHFLHPVPTQACNFSSQSISGEAHTVPLPLSLRVRPVFCMVLALGTLLKPFTTPGLCSDQKQQAQSSRSVSFWSCELFITVSGCLGDGSGRRTVR